MLETTSPAFNSLGFILLIIALALILLLVILFRNPYSYPYYTIDLDVSGRRNITGEEEIESYLLKHGISEFQKHYDFVENWKKSTSHKAHTSLLHFIRVSQYEKILDDANMFVFQFRRKQTRYKQRNYHRTPYTVFTISYRLSCDYGYILRRFHALSQIDFETTTFKYHAKKQRNLLTAKLREQIKIRDNYTCQRCGKYMPDGVGLHIDHIVPISKGGKTVASNLQVLCSKCNGHKFNHL